MKPIDFDFSKIPQDMPKAVYVALNCKNVFTEIEVNKAICYIQTAEPNLKSFIESIFNEQSILFDEESERILNIFQTKEEKQVYTFAEKNFYPMEYAKEFCIYQKSKNWEYNGEKIKNPIGAFICFVRHKNVQEKM